MEFLFRPLPGSYRFLKTENGDTKIAGASVPCRGLIGFFGETESQRISVALPSPAGVL